MNFIMNFSQCELHTNLQISVECHLMTVIGVIGASKWTDQLFVCNAPKEKRNAVRF